MEDLETDRDFVGMANCYICGEVKHLLLDRRIKKTLPPSAVYDKIPCEKCLEFMKQGIIFIGVRDNEQDKENPYRTGEFLVIKEEAVKRFPMNKELLEGILKKRICFIEQSVLKNLGIDKFIKK